MDSDPIERHLAAILSADAVGYSRLMAEDEAGTIRTLTAYRSEISTLAEQHRGRVVDAPGDNVLAEFPTALDAVECATEIQRVLQARNQSLADERRMDFRIGVHLGDVAMEGERIYGDGVNIAARLEALAEPGGICISAAVHEQVGSKLDLGYEDLGEQSVKNIPTPVRVYRVRLDGTRATAPKSTSGAWTRLRIAAASIAVLVVLVGAGLWLSWPAPLGLVIDWYGLSELPQNPALPAKPSLVVLPFDNLSADPEQGYFADGLTEEITARLSRVPQLFVISRNTAFTYQGSATRIEDVGRDLGVRYVLEGSVRKAGDRVRITAQLIEAASDHHVWSEQYDRDLADIFEIQSEIGGEILNALSIQIREAESQRARKIPTRDLNAYDAFVRGSRLLRRTTRRDNESARELLNRSIELDPGFADAHATLGATFLIPFISGWITDPGTLDRAEALARTALSMDPQSEAAHAVLSSVLINKGQHDEARASAVAAADLAVGTSEGRISLAILRLQEGSYLAALADLRDVIRHDPSPSPGTLGVLGSLNYLAGRTQAGVALFERARTSSRDMIPPRLSLAYHYQVTGQLDRAREMVAEIRRINPAYTAVDGERFSLAKDPDSFVDALREAGLPDQAQPGVTTDTSGRPGIAVLPFCNLSRDPEQEYFVEGVTDDLTAALSRSPDLLVISRSSSSRYACQPADVKQVGRELGVRYAVEGSVRRAQDRVRIMAQLIDATTDVHVWSQSYDRDLSPANVFDIQSDIARQIADALQVQLLDWEGQRPSDDPTAWDLYARGRFLARRATPESTLEARSLLQRAIELDPEFSSAHALLASTYQLEALHASPPDPALLDRVDIHARRALALDPRNHDAHLALSWFYSAQRQFGHAIREAKRAIELSPSFDAAHQALGMNQLDAGRLDEARQASDMLIRLNPEFPPGWLLQGGVQYLDGEVDEAIENWERARTAGLAPIPVLIFLTNHYESVGRHDDARATAREILSLQPGFTAAGSREFLSWKDEWIPKDLETRLRSAGLP